MPSRSRWPGLCVGGLASSGQQSVDNDETYYPFSYDETSVVRQQLRPISDAGLRDQRRQTKRRIVHLVILAEQYLAPKQHHLSSLSEHRGVWMN